MNSNKARVIVENFFGLCNWRSEWEWLINANKAVRPVRAKTGLINSYGKLKMRPSKPSEPTSSTEFASPLVKWADRLNLLPARKRLMIVPGVVKMMMAIPNLIQGSESNQIVQGVTHSNIHSAGQTRNMFSRNLWMSLCVTLLSFTKKPFIQSFRELFNQRERGGRSQIYMTTSTKSIAR